MILVTGSTGTNGSEAVKQLAATGAKVRALVHNPAKAQAIEAPNVEIVAGDLADPASLGAALQGVERAYLVVPADARSVEMHRNFIEAAKAAGVRHIVKLSVMGADVQSPVTFARWHAQGEKLLEESGLSWTFVRPNSFMQNMLGVAGSIASEGVFYQPGGDAPVSHVDARDITAVAVKALTEDGHEGQTHVLTGPEGLSFQDIAQKLSAVTGKSVSYVDISPDQFKTALMGYGMPAEIADGMNELYAVIRAGYMGQTTDTVAQVAGRAPTSFDQFARDHAAAFASS